MLTRRAQGKLEGKLVALGFELRQRLLTEAWSQEAVSTAAIEGEHLDLHAVRSSVIRRVTGCMHQGPATPRHVDGLLDMMEDASAHSAAPLSHERLQAWQAALFPTGFSGMVSIRVGAYRNGCEPMQIISGPIGRETIHYEAPSALAVQNNMERLLEWFNSKQEPENLIRAAIAHFWFETIHPFEDGNGRIGRAMIDVTLAQDAGTESRLIRISQRLLERRSDYYSQLNAAQRGSLDITQWIVWFITQVRFAYEQAAIVIDTSLEKARFWLDHSEKALSQRQRKVLNLLLDAGPNGFTGAMNTKKYASITSASRATASRDLIELEYLTLLCRTGVGPATRYYINIPGWVPI
jgi:Fic family protein